MQALILAGGEGTRLRPLTTTYPKPVVPLVDRPFIGFMLDWLRSHGVDEVIMGCGHMADGVQAVLGDGSGFGIKLSFLVEPRPLGTGGALKFAEDKLDERFLMLNGDVLTDLDLTAQIAQHEATGARGTLALTPVEDPSAYGLVRLTGEGAVTEFVEKPSADQIDTNNISAGAYVLERSVLELLEPGKPASIERDVFPRLVGDGLYGYVGEGYWMDIGTPERYLQGTFDILEGTVETEVAARMGPGFASVAGDVESAGRIIPSALVESGCRIGAHSQVGGRVVLERGVTVGEHTTVERAVVLEGATIGSNCTLSGCIVGAGVDDRRRLPRRRAQRARQGRAARRRQHRLQRRADLPGRVAAGRGDPVLMAAPLDAAAVAAVDSTGQAAEILDLPAHLRDALWRVDSAGIAPVDAPGGVVVAGMGGSAVGGRLAQAALGPRLTRPFVVADGYALPSWVGPRAPRAVRELLRRHRGDPRRLRRRARARGARGSSPRPAARWPSAPAATARP